MGMFSWACKGCGHDLKSGELVRMNGCRGEYDGYGGNSGGFDHDNCEGEPVCWHERCYKRASNAERDDDTPSDNARNQGFGHPALEFLKGYRDQAETTYKVVVYAWAGSYPNQKRQEFHVVREGEELVLLDQLAYKEAWENGAPEPLPENWVEMTEEEWATRLQRMREKFEAETGLKNPELNSVSFHSLDEAKKAADLLIKIPEYDLVIFGEQGDLKGQCYERERHKKYRRVDLQPTGEYREEVVYELGVPNKNQKNRLARVDGRIAS